jgi:hypothetical protein
MMEIPARLRDAVTVVGMHLMAAARDPGSAREPAMSVLSGDPRQVDMLQVVSVIEARRADGYPAAAEQLLGAVAMIAVHGGWQTVLEDPAACDTWVRLRQRAGH